MDEYINKLETALAETCKALIELSENDALHKQQIVEELKQRLSVRIKINTEGYTGTWHNFKVQLYLDEELISEDSDSIQIDKD